MTQMQEKSKFGKYDVRHMPLYPQYDRGTYNFFLVDRDYDSFDKCLYDDIAGIIIKDRRVNDAYGGKGDFTFNLNDHGISLHSRGPFETHLQIRGREWPIEEIEKLNQTVKILEEILR